MLKKLGVAHRVGIEGHKESCEKALAEGNQHAVTHGDIRHLTRYFSGKSFDAVVANEVIEHLPKADGYPLLEQMEKLARKRVIITTPSGFLDQPPAADNPLQEHLSGWTAEEMRGRGFTVIGRMGWKGFRGHFGLLKWKPKVFWSIVSFLTHVLWTRKHPEQAAGLLCIKRL
ncbi:MAG: class I SAM-dependent methyltransferase [Verrucomicrobia bacterium]|nr:class I SAM-dependent methyltransferase [Verrucomicrobiota bacterium]